jgi:hypothetical protein
VPEQLFLNEAHMFGSLLNTVIDIATQPIVDTCDLIDGLTEGEFRHRAALRLGADVVAGMTLSEVIDAMGKDII